VARAELVPPDALRQLALAVVNELPAARLALQVLSDDGPGRLARAIELAGLVLDRSASQAVQR
jgi:hypothetical protein